MRILALLSLLLAACSPAPTRSPSSVGAYANWQDYALTEILTEEFYETQARQGMVGDHEALLKDNWSTRRAESGFAFSSFGRSPRQVTPIPRPACRASRGEIYPTDPYGDKNYHFAMVTDYHRSAIPYDTYACIRSNEETVPVSIRPQLLRECRTLVRENIPGLLSGRLNLSANSLSLPGRTQRVQCPHCLRPSDVTFALMSDTYMDACGNMFRGWFVKFYPTLRDNLQNGMGILFAPGRGAYNIYERDGSLSGSRNMGTHAVQENAFEFFTALSPAEVAAVERKRLQATQRGGYTFNPTTHLYSEVRQP